MGDSNAEWSIAAGGRHGLLYIGARLHRRECGGPRAIKLRAPLEATACQGACHDLHRR